MRRLLAVLVVLPLLVACKKAPQQETKAPGKQVESKQGKVPTPPPAPSDRQQQAGLQQPGQPVQPPPPPPPPPPPAVNLDELVDDDPSCVDKKAQQDREFRRDKLPRLHEEEQALAIMDNWLRSTADILSLEENDRLLGIMKKQGEGLRECRRSFDEKVYQLLTMVALPGAGDGERYPLHFCEGSLGPLSVEWCGPLLVRLGQWELLDALWTEGGAAPQYCGGIVDPGAADPQQALVDELRDYATCRATLASDDCSAEGLRQAQADAVDDFKAICRALKSTPEELKCSTDQPENEAACALSFFKSSLRKGEGCLRLNRYAKTAIPNVFCMAPDLFKDLECETLLDKVNLPTFTELHQQSCELASLARNHEPSCSKTLEGTPQCLLYEAYLNSIPSEEEEPLMAQRVTKVPLERPWAETLLAVTGMQLASTVPSAAVYGEADWAPEGFRHGAPPPDEMPEVDPGEPPPTNAGPRKHEHKVLPNLWGQFEGDSDRPINRPPGPPHDPGAGMRRPEGPPGQLLAGPPRDKYDDGIGEPPAEVVPGAGQPAGMPPRTEQPENLGEFKASPDKPGDRPPPQNPQGRLVRTQFAHPLTLTGGPLQRAMASFARSTLVVPGALDNHRGSPCDGLYTEAQLLPAPGGMLEIRLRALNVSERDLQCEFKMLVEGTSGRAEKRRDLTIPAGAIVPLNVTFEFVEKAHKEIAHACAPVFEPAEEKKAATPKDVAAP